jgi:hypothetical protein
MRMRNMLIGRDGSSLSGELIDKSITIASMLGRVRVKTSAIAWIHFNGTPSAKSDELWLHNGDRISGVISGTKLRWRDSSDRTHAIPYRNIHSVVLSSGAA